MRKSERQLHFQTWKTLSDADVCNGLKIFQEWITLGFHDKLSYGNLRVSGGGQVYRDRTGKKSRKRKMGTSWEEAAEDRRGWRNCVAQCRPERGPEIPEILKSVLKFTKCPEICPICPEILKI